MSDSTPGNMRINSGHARSPEPKNEVDPVPLAAIDWMDSPLP